MHARIALHTAQALLPNKGHYFNLGQPLCRLTRRIGYLHSMPTHPCSARRSDVAGASVIGRAASFPSFGRPATISRRCCRCAWPPGSQCRLPMPARASERVVIGARKPPVNELLIPQSGWPGVVVRSRVHPITVTSTPGRGWNARSNSSAAASRTTNVFRQVRHGRRVRAETVAGRVHPCGFRATTCEMGGWIADPVRPVCPLTATLLRVARS